MVVMTRSPAKTLMRFKIEDIIVNKLILVFLSLLSSFAFAKELVVKSGTDIQTVINQANDGDTILVEPGVYHQSVYIDKENITFKGLRDGEKRATFDGKMKLNDGIIASGHGSVIDGFEVRGYKGNGIMTQGANNFKIINNKVEGAFYGIFPQYGKNGLVAGNEVTGAEDAGVYVGMCDHIDVINNVAHGNVMGLEFENTRNALMANNHVYNNTAGLMMTLIPGLPVKTASDLVIRNNKIVDNNLDNFAPASSIASMVPKGIGLGVVGVDNVIIIDNHFEGNGNIAITAMDLVSFGVGEDPKIDSYVDGIQIRENTYVDNGNNTAGLYGDMIAMTGNDGFEILDSGKTRGGCHVNQPDVQTLGIENYALCEAEFDRSNFETAQLDEPIKSQKYTAKQKGRLTYLAVCTGCHSYSSVLHGPSIESIKAIYQSDVEALKAYITNPVRKRAGFPEMPAQAYLGEETINAISSYILFELDY